MTRVLVIGSGFTGATIANRLASAGIYVDVLESRDHIAGNCFDYIDEKTGIRIHKYGPHIWHTNDAHIHAYVGMFTNWIAYHHKVEAKLEDGRTVPFPINKQTLETIYEQKFQSVSKTQRFLENIQSNHQGPKNAAQFIENRVGKKLADIFYRPYSEKMWGMKLEMLASNPLARIPVRFDDCNLYFPDDAHQAMPDDGYTNLIRRMLDDDKIDVALETLFDHSMVSNYDHVFYSGAIDEFYDYKFEALPYRSIKFTRFNFKTGQEFRTACTNFTTQKTKFTRVTEWSHFPNTPKCKSGFDSPVTFEEPCDYSHNDNKRFYPVKDADGIYQAHYQKYAEYAKEFSPNVTFCGRLGTYKYLDMHQAVGAALSISKRFIYGK